MNIMNSGRRSQDELCSDIDFVLTWVDGSDLEWQAQKALYSREEARATGFNTFIRYRDWGIMRYWFRAAEKYASWVRKIHFVTCGQIPEWLNLNHPKLHFVRHEDYIPSEYLPTFSSHTIELNFHRITGLAEKFVYFNDDMLINAPVRPEDFFMNGLPRSLTGLNITYARKKNLESKSFLSDVQAVNTHFNFMSGLRKNFRKWITLRSGAKYLIKTLLLLPFGYYTGFNITHSAGSFLKSTFLDVWEKEGKWLNETCSHRFRELSDVNQWLFEFWQIASGNFWPLNPSRSQYYSVEEIPEAAQDVREGRHKIICLNDSGSVRGEEYERLAEIIRYAYSEKLPEKSAFEL